MQHQPQEQLANDLHSPTSLDAIEETLVTQEDFINAELLPEQEENDDWLQADNLLKLDENKYPVFTLAKNKARFLRMVSWYRAKEEWIDVAPLSGATKLLKHRPKSSKLFALINWITRWS